MKKKTLTLILFLFLLLNFEYGIACTCIGSETVKAGIKRSDVVMIGTIINKQIITLTDSLLYKMALLNQNNYNISIFQLKIAKYDFLVESTYKGKVTHDTVVVFSGNGGGDCGYEFTKGKKYIIYGDKNSFLNKNWTSSYQLAGRNIFWTNICTRTTLFNKTEIEEIEKVCRRKKSRS